MGDIERKKFNKNWNQSDVVFVVDGEELYGHYKILASASDVLSKLMNEGGEGDGNIKRVELPDKDRRSFYILFCFLYPSAVKPQITEDRDVLKQVLEYTKEYKLDSVAMQIDVLLSRQIIQNKEKQTVPLIVRDLLLAETYNLKATRIFCIKYLISVDGEVDFEQRTYKQLSAETKHEILSERLFRFINTTVTYIPDLNRSVVQFSRKNTSWEALKALSSNNYR